MNDLQFIIYTKPVYSINLSTVPKEDYIYYLIDVLFYNEPEFVHYHANKYDNEKMLLISENNYFKLIEKLDYIPFKKYNQIQIVNTKDFLTESGMVSNISSKFSENNISILYITTNSNNFIFIDESDFEKTWKILETITENITVF